MRAYRALLRLYPASFRAEYGPELCRVFAERHREASGWLARLAFWAETLADLLPSAALAHWDILRQDLRHTARSLRRTPGFTATAVLVTALGIGANAAVFSIVDQVLIRPLPYPEPQRLVRLWTRTPDFGQLELSPANYRDWRRMSRSFEQMGSYFASSAVNLVGVGEPLRLESSGVDAELLTTLGVEPALGRLFEPADDREGAPGTVLLSHALWQRAFAGDPAVIGRVVRLDDESFSVIGVMPPQFAYPSRRTQLWRPLRLGPRAFEDRSDAFLEAVAKLKPGVSLEQAQAEMDLMVRQLEREHPAENAGMGAQVVALRDAVSRQTRLLLAALSGASACVLLIACTNLASLLLARAVGRRKELSVRAALGAGRERLVRQLLTEALVLALAGGLAGVAAAGLSVPLLGALVPATLPTGEATPLDTRVLAFAAGLTILTGLAFGVLPALRSCGGDGAAGLREGARSGLGGTRQRLRAGLIVAEVTACVVLLIASGLLIRALWRVQSTDPGFRTEGVLTVQTPLPLPRYAITARRAEFYDRVLPEVRGLPGVTSAAYASFLPLLHGGGIWSVRMPGAPPVPERSGPTASLRFVTPGYFAAMGIPLQRGRDVADSDSYQAPFVAVVSASLAQEHWPGQDPLGQRFGFAQKERQVVGVVADVRMRGLERESEPQVYIPYRQVDDGAQDYYIPKELVIRATGDLQPLAAAVRGIVRRAEPELPIAALRTLQEVVESQTAPRVIQLRVLGLFTGLAVLLGGLGIYGLLSFLVSQRLPEFGVRIALGAGSRDLLRLVLRQGLALAAAGGLLGLVLAYGAARAMQALLAGVRPDDASTYAAAAGVTLLTALVGSLVPALRALRVDPTRALRAE
jgi:putative ABC transport system permease protein